MPKKQTPPSLIPDFLDVGAVASMLMCSRQTVRRLSRQHILPPPIFLGRFMPRWSRKAIELKMQELERFPHFAGHSRKSRKAKTDPQTPLAAMANSM